MRGLSGWSRLALRLFHLALRAYPRAFRHAYGDGMRDALAEDWSRLRGVRASIAFLVGNVAHLIWFGWLTRRDAARPAAATIFSSTTRRKGLPMPFDARHAIRSLRAAPGLTTIAIGSLALGIGANIALFSIVNSLVLKPLPVRDPSRLALIEPGSWSTTVWFEIRDRYAPELSDGAFAWSVERFNLASRGEMDFADGIYASGAMFDVLGVQAMVGRTLTPADDVAGGGAEGPVAVISHAFWQRRYGGTVDAIGRQITIEQTPFTIVGVMPPRFFGPDVGRRADVIVPLGSATLSSRRQSGFSNRSSTWLNMMLRLRADRTAEETIEALRAVQPQIREATRPATRADRAFLPDPFVLEPAEHGRSTLRARYEQPLTIILVVVGLVLLAACVNIANLLLARATARRQELAIRLALGASRARLARDLLSESAVISLAGAALGLLGAQWASQLLVQQIATSTVAVFLDLAIDWRVVAFTAGCAIATTLLFGLAPMTACAVAPSNALRARGRGVTGDGRVGVRGFLMIVQVAVSLTLVTGAGLFLRTFSSLTSVPLGFDRSGLLIVNLDLQRSGQSIEERLMLSDRLHEAVAAVPGVHRAALSYSTPLGTRGWNGPVAVPGRPVLGERERIGWVNGVSPGWLATYGIPLRRGRDIGPADRRGAPAVAVVNEAFARRFFGDEDPIGRQFTGGTDREQTIVGIVGDAVYRNQRQGAVPTMYVPFVQLEDTFQMFSLTVRARTIDATLTRAIADAIDRIDSRAAFSFRTYADQHGASVAQERLVAMLSAMFGGLALLLAALGLYGVTSYSVNRRRAEIGVRLALGAEPGEVVGMVLRRLATLAVIGVVVGLALSFWLTTFVETLLFQLQPRDPATFAGAAAVLLCVTFIAGWQPARRAARIDPIIVLREQ